jgi:hypothetical protein
LEGYGRADGADEHGHELPERGRIEGHQGTGEAQGSASTPKAQQVEVPIGLTAQRSEAQEGAQSWVRIPAGIPQAVEGVAEPGAQQGTGIASGSHWVKDPAGHAAAVQVAPSLPALLAASLPPSLPALLAASLPPSLPPMLPPESTVAAPPQDAAPEAQIKSAAPTALAHERMEPNTVTPGGG